MSLKWKTAFTLFMTSIVLLPLTAEYILRSAFDQQANIEKVAHQQLLNQLVVQADDILINHKAPTTKQFLPLQKQFQQYSDLLQYEGFYLYKNDKLLLAHDTQATLPLELKNQPFQKRLTTDTSVYLLMIAKSSVAGEQLLILNNNNLSILLAAIFLLTLIGYVIGNRHGLKVDEIIVGISKAGGGNYSQRISLSGNDEVAQLVISYNRMLDNLLLASQESKEQLQSYKSILDTAAEGVITINDRGVIQEFNQTSSKMFDYIAEEIIGKNISKLIPTKIKQEDGSFKEQAFLKFDELVGQSMELIGRRSNEEYFPIDLSVSASTINNHQIFTAILRDVSDRLDRENQQRSLEMQLRTLQRKQAVESLTGGIAHDFNNILGPVLGYADMALMEAEEGTRQHKYLTSILSGAHRARELVARIMAFTRQYEQAREHIHLISVIEESINFLKSSIPSEHKIETFFNTENDLVAAESTQLKQVLVSMVTNASQSLENMTGSITIRLDNVTPDEKLLAKSGRLHSVNYVRIRIQDTGSGMDAMTRASVFEPFFSTKEKNQGSGLGLSVASGIITNFGGDILVESELGKGSEFTVYLPTSDGENKKQQTEKQSTPLSKGGELILYIDDDEVIVELGKEMLESLGYEVAVSVSSEKALQMFSQDPGDFDLIITDQSMPVLTGTQLSKEFKKIRADIPIILVTGFSASILNQDLADSGIDHCITKPLVMNELGEIVMQALTTKAEIETT